jgi:hypothetical protein
MFKAILMALFLFNISSAYALTSATAKCFGTCGLTHSGNDINYIDIRQTADLNNLLASVSVTTSYPVSFFQPINASVVYYMQVSSSAPSAPQVIVPLLITAFGDTIASGTNFAEAYISFGQSGGAGPNRNMYACTGTTGCIFNNTNTSFNGTFAASVFSDSEYEIGLSAKVMINGTIGTASATVDPFIQIDPKFKAIHPEYSLTFSNGITNLQAVPEPETYAMMMTGLGVMGFVGRRRKKQVA